MDTTCMYTHTRTQSHTRTHTVQFMQSCFKAIVSSYIVSGCEGMDQLAIIKIARFWVGHLSWVSSVDQSSCTETPLPGKVHNTDIPALHFYKRSSLEHWLSASIQILPVYLARIKPAAVYKHLGNPRLSCDTVGGTVEYMKVVYVQMYSRGEAI